MNFMLKTFKGLGPVVVPMMVTLKHALGRTVN